MDHIEEAYDTYYEMSTTTAANPSRPLVINSASQCEVTRPTRSASQHPGCSSQPRARHSTSRALRLRWASCNSGVVNTPALFECLLQAVESADPSSAQGRKEPVALPNSLPQSRRPSCDVVMLPITAVSPRPVPADRQGQRRRRAAVPFAASMGRARSRLSLFMTSSKKRLGSSEAAAGAAAFVTSPGAAGPVVGLSCCNASLNSAGGMLFSGANDSTWPSQLGGISARVRPRT